MPAYVVAAHSSRSVEQLAGIGYMTEYEPPPTMLHLSQQVHARVTRMSTHALVTQTRKPVLTVISFGSGATEGWQPHADLFFLTNFRRMPTANTEGQTESEGSVGKAWVETHL